MQQVIESALTKIGWDGKSILAAGRTDAGVHASGQVVAFDHPWNHSDDDLLRALNSVLPVDVSARQVTGAADDFHPRFDAIARRYRYQILCESTPNPLRERFMWRVWPPLEPGDLQKYADQFIGTHDFSGFGTPPIEGGTTVRKVVDTRWYRQDSVLCFEIEANAFLYKMVRRIVQVQVDIANGLKSADELDQLLNNKINSIVSGVAPAHGLTLLGVRYPENSKTNWY